MSKKATKGKEEKIAFFLNGIKGGHGFKKKGGWPLFSGESWRKESRGLKKS